ncbi:MAG: hypothetical protein KDA96_27965 [Planctomycetaceae bacterium]|nr:hypothetical protein [Planctomycetaceae bacterium]
MFISVALICGCDSVWSRKQVAEDLTAAAKRVEANPGDVNSLRQIEDAANGSYRFEQCYALGTLGRLGKGALPALPTIQRHLLSDDPYIRDAAAHATFRLGADAQPLRAELARLIRMHVNEGAAMYAVRALGEIGNPSPDVFEVLQFAEQSDCALVSEAASKVLAQFGAVEQ